MNWKDIFRNLFRNSKNNRRKIPHMEPGDIILIRDPDVRLVWRIDYWIHTMMYVDKEKGKHKIIESCTDGVHETTLENIFEKYNVTNWTVLRVKRRGKRKEKPDINKIIKFVKEKAENQVPFDTWSFITISKQYEPPKHHPGYGYYCGELVWAAYMSEGIDIDPNKKGWIEDWEIYVSPEVDRVYVERPFEVLLFQLFRIRYKSPKKVKNNEK